MLPDAHTEIVSANWLPVHLPEIFNSSCKSLKMKKEKNQYKPIKMCLKIIWEELTIYTGHVFSVTIECKL